MKKDALWVMLYTFIALCLFKFIMDKKEHTGAVKDIAFVMNKEYDLNMLTTADFSQKEFLLDTIDMNDTISKVITITNTGDKDLVFDTIIPSCGCTNVLYSKEYIKPKEFTKVSFHVIGSKSGVPIVSSLIIKANLKEQPVFIGIKGYVR